MPPGYYASVAAPGAPPSAGRDRRGPKNRAASPKLSSMVTWTEPAPGALSINIGSGPGGVAGSQSHPGPQANLNFSSSLLLRVRGRLACISVDRRRTSQVNLELQRFGSVRIAKVDPTACDSMEASVLRSDCAEANELHIISPSPCKQMLRAILSLVLIFSSAAVLHADPAAEQPCIDKGLEITSDNDNAIMRVRSILEAPPVREFLVSALHLTKIGGSYLPPTLAPCMTLIEARESGPGAKITYLYQWQTALSREFNQLSVYCDNTGHIDTCGSRTIEQ